MGTIGKYLGSEGVDRITVGRFYVAVVQSVILFGSRTWVLNPWLEKALEGFHHRVVLTMMGMGPKRQWDGTWVYSPIGEALAKVGLDDIGLYTTRCQNTVTQYITTRPIMELFLAAERNPGLCLSSRWWGQPALDTLGTRAGNAAAEGGEETGTEESEGEGDE